MGSNGKAGNNHALDELVRVLVDDVAILESARLGLVAVADEINGFGVIGWDEPPFNTRRETGTTTTAQSSSFYLVGDGFGIHLEGFFELFITAVLNGTFNGCVPSFTIDIFENKSVLARMWFFAWKVFNFCVF